MNNDLEDAPATTDKRIKDLPIGEKAYTQIEAFWISEEGEPYLNVFYLTNPLYEGLFKLRIERVGNSYNVSTGDIPNPPWKRVAYRSTIPASYWYGEVGSVDDNIYPLLSKAALNNQRVIAASNEDYTKAGKIRDFILEKFF